MIAFESLHKSQELWWNMDLLVICEIRVRQRLDFGSKISTHRAGLARRHSKETARLVESAGFSQATYEQRVTHKADD